ncbi:hypothetical protein [Luteimonas sp. A482]
MSKRPVQRQASRGTSTAQVDQSVAGMQAAGLSGQPAIAGNPELQATPGAVPASREELTGMLDELRERRGLGVADEAAILREYDGLTVELRAEKTRLAAEFRERSKRDGLEEANAWLAAAADALGRRQGEQMRQLVQTIPAFTQAQA